MFGSRMAFIRIIFLMIMSVSLQAINPFNGIQEYLAHKDYEHKNFRASQNRYQNLLEETPYDPVDNYNMGTVLYKQQKYDDALSYFQRAIDNAKSNNELLEKSYFNKGNSYVQLKHYDKALESYFEVLKLNSVNDRAKNNIEYVKKLQEEKKKEEQKKQQDQEEQKQQQQDKKQDRDKKNDDNNQQGQQNKNDSSDQMDKKDDQDSSKSKNGSQDKDKKNGKKDELDNHNDGDKEEKKDHNNKSDNNNDSADNDAFDKNKDQKSKQDQSDKENAQNSQQSMPEKSRDDIKNELQKPEESEKGIDNKEGQNGSSREDIGNFESQESPSPSQEKLQDLYASKVEGSIKEDNRLDKKQKNILALLQDQEDAIQKQLLKLQVSKGGDQKYGQKNW